MSDKKHDIVEQYISAIEKVEGDYTIEDVRRAFESGLQIGELMGLLCDVEENINEH